MNELRECWTAEVAPSLPAGQAAGDDAGAVVDDALSLLAAQGEVFVSAGVAYLDPAFITSLMKPLVDHRLARRTLALGFATGADHAATLLAAVDELVGSGVLRESLLPMLWREAGLEQAAYDAVLTMLTVLAVTLPILETVFERTLFLHNIATRLSSAIVVALSPRFHSAGPATSRAATIKV